MSQANEEILSIMKLLGSGQSTEGKTLRLDTQSQKFVLIDVLDPKTKQIIQKYTSPNDPDALPEIDPTDVIVFIKIKFYNPVFMVI